MSGNSIDKHKIAELSGLSIEAVDTLTEVANCNTCLWFKSFNFPLKTPAQALSRGLKMKLSLGEAGLLTNQTTGTAEVDISGLPKMKGKRMEKDVRIQMG